MALRLRLRGPNGKLHTASLVGTSTYSDLVQECSTAFSINEGDVEVLLLNSKGTRVRCDAAHNTPLNTLVKNMDTVVVENGKCVPVMLTMPIPPPEKLRDVPFNEPPILSPKNSPKQGVALEDVLKMLQGIGGVCEDMEEILRGEELFTVSWDDEENGLGIKARLENERDRRHIDKFEWNGGVDLICTDGKHMQLTGADGKLEKCTKSMYPIKAKMKPKSLAHIGGRTGLKSLTKAFGCGTVGCAGCGNFRASEAVVLEASKGACLELEGALKAQAEQQVNNFVSYVEKILKQQQILFPSRKDVDVVHNPQDAANERMRFFSGHTMAGVEVTCMEYSTSDVFDALNRAVRWILDEWERERRKKEAESGYHSEITDAQRSDERYKIRQAMLVCARYECLGGKLAHDHNKPKGANLPRLQILEKVRAFWHSGISGNIDIDPAAGKILKVLTKGDTVVLTAATPVFQEGKEVEIKTGVEGVVQLIDDDGNAHVEFKVDGSLCVGQVTNANLKFLEKKALSQAEMKALRGKRFNPPPRIPAEEVDGDYLYILTAKNGKVRGEFKGRKGLADQELKKRVVNCLECYRLKGRGLPDHFEEWLVEEVELMEKWGARQDYSCSLVVSRFPTAYLPKDVNGHTVLVNTGSAGERLPGGQWRVTNEYLQRGDVGLEGSKPPTAGLRYRSEKNIESFFDTNEFCTKFFGAPYAGFGTVISGTEDGHWVRIVLPRAPENRLLASPCLNRLVSAPHRQFANPNQETCWLSSMFQSLWRSVVFRYAWDQHLEAMQDTEPVKEDPAYQNILIAFQATWRQMTDATELVSPNELQEALGIAGYGDPADFFSKLSEAFRFSTLSGQKIGDSICQVTVPVFAYESLVKKMPDLAAVWAQMVDTLGATLAQRAPLVAVQIESQRGGTPVFLDQADCKDLVDRFKPKGAGADLGRTHRVSAIICIRENPRHYVAFCRRLQSPEYCYVFDDLPGILKPILSEAQCNEFGVYEGYDVNGQWCYRDAEGQEVDTRTNLLPRLLDLLDSTEKKQEFMDNGCIFHELSWDKVPNLCEMYHLQTRLVLYESRENVYGLFHGAQGGDA